MFNSRKSFVFDGVSLLQDYGYILAEFEEKSEIALALARTLDKGTTNKYKAQYDVYGVTYDSELVLPISIIKNICDPAVTDLKFSREDIRQLASWTTSKQTPAWLYFEDEEEHADSVRYRGMFTDIQPFVAGEIVGVTLTFTCTSSYAYTHEITETVTVNGEETLTINNTSDEWEDYVYPVIRVECTDLPTSEGYGEMVIINTSESSVVADGELTVDPTASTQEKLEDMKDLIEDYAELWGYEIEYKTDSSDVPITMGDNHAVFFNLIEHDGTTHKCIGYYTEDNTYYIAENAYMYFNILEGLPVNIDCQKVKIYDDIGRMILYSTMGIDDVDEFYWLRLKHGANDLLFFSKGEADVTFTYSEPRKVGELYED